MQHCARLFRERAMRGDKMKAFEVGFARRGAALGNLAVAPFTARGADAAAAPNDTCLMCHADAGAKNAAGASSLDAKTFAASVHGQMNFKCTDCHSDVSADKLPHEPKLKPADCAACHEAPVKEYLSTAHAKARAGGNLVAATCSNCHGNHDIQKSSEPIRARMWPGSSPPVPPAMATKR